MAVKKEIKIVNIVATASLERAIPLVKLAEALPNTEYNPEQFPGLVMKIKVKITVQPKFTVQNLVAAGSIGLDLNLNALAIQLSNTEYEPEQFPGLVYKLPGTRATFLLFSNGKIVCTGTRSEAKLHEAVDLLIKELAKVGYK